MKNIFQKILIVIFLFFGKPGNCDSLTVAADWKLNDYKKLTTKLEMVNSKRGEKLPDKNIESHSDIKIISADKHGYKLKMTTEGNTSVIEELRTISNEAVLMEDMLKFASENPYPPTTFMFDSLGRFISIENIQDYKDYLIKMMKYLNKYDSSRVANFSDESLEKTISKSIAMIFHIYGKTFNTDRPLIDTVSINEKGKTIQILQKWTSKKISRDIWEIRLDNDFALNNPGYKSVVNYYKYTYNRKTTWVEKMNMVISVVGEEFSMSSDIEITLE